MILRKIRATNALGSAILLAMLLASSSILAQNADSTAIRIHADRLGKATPLKHFWSTTVGAGRANEGLRATWQDQLGMAVRAGGFQYVRFHGLFHDDMFVYHERDGVQVYNFQYIDDLFDRMLANHARPFVELGFSPSDMATTLNNTGFWWRANGSPPKDYAKWAELVRHFVDHCIQRYGADEVHQWYFEVWNEPNLSGFFNGTQAQYFELYKITAHTIKNIDPALRVGGPATSNFNLDAKVLAKAKAEGADLITLPWQPLWIKDFLAYCQKNKLSVDFISTHPYPQDFALDESKSANLRRSVNSTRDDLRLLRTMINESPYPRAEIHLTEWNSSPSPRDFTHDGLPAAAFVAKCNLESLGLVDSLSYWTFTDVFEEQGFGDTIFHGGFGMINYQDIPKPTFHAYRFMNALGDELLESTTGAIVTRDKKSGLITAMAYNYPSEVKIALPVTHSIAEADKWMGTGSARHLYMTLTGLPPNAALQIETLDKTHGNATEAWKAMGSPESPTRAQTEALRAAAWATKKDMVLADPSGKLVVDEALDAWSLVLIRQL